MTLTSPRFADNPRLQKAAQNQPPMKIGEPSGQPVAILQQALFDLHYPMPISFKKGGPDGIYGKETSQVVRQFQMDQGFDPSGWDGRAGRDTLTRLDQLFPPPRPLPPLPPPLPPPIPPRRGGTSPIHILPDKGQLLASEKNVSVSGGLKPDDAYDLALFRELGNPRRGVLVVTVILNFKFLDGTSKTTGQPLTWSAQDKSDFMSGVKTALQDVWGEKHRITTVGTAPPVTDVGVLFDIQPAGGLSIFTHAHWNMNTTKVDKFTTSSVTDGGGSFATNGEVTLDSGDLTPENKGGPQKQRGVVHEFGHMLGYRDEYKNAAGAAEDNPNWLTDLASIMNSSETVRDRHYVFFADWLNQQFGAGVVWRVNGVTDLTNAKI